MKRDFTLLLHYARLIAKKWVLWILLALDAIALIVRYSIPNTQLPQIVYWLLAIGGFFWAGYQVFRETVVKIPNRAGNLIKRAKLSIKISLNEGNQYSYSLDKLDQSAELPTLPNATFTLHIKIENNGNIPVEILSIGGSMSLIGYPLYSDSTDDFTLDDETFVCPFLLKIGKIITCHLITKIYPGPTDSDVLFAADFKKFSRLPKSSQTMDVFVKVVNPDGDPIVFRHGFAISVKPLYDQYIALWKKMRKNELVRLAGTKSDANDHQLENN